MHTNGLAVPFTSLLYLFLISTYYLKDSTPCSSTELLHMTRYFLTFSLIEVIIISSHYHITSWPLSNYTELCRISDLTSRPPSLKFLQHTVPIFFCDSTCHKTHPSTPLVACSQVIRRRLGLWPTSHISQADKIQPNFPMTPIWYTLTCGKATRLSGAKPTHTHTPVS